MASQLPFVCIIGAGSSGLSAMRELKERQIPFEAFESSDKVGGLWVYGDDNKASAAYRSLHINTSSRAMEYACYPMPKDFPTYCHNSLIAKYFDDFAEHFDLKKSIRFNTKVEDAERLDSGLWRITLSTGEIKLYDALVVANGHHWDPQWPDPGFPGQFDGVSMHSHAYKDPKTPYDLQDKRVVIVGMGNSAMDIACELSSTRNAAKVTLAIRRGTHVMPKFFGKTPIDSLVRHPSKQPWLIEKILPKGWFSKMVLPLLHLRTKLAVGNPEDFGLPKPKHKFGETHPTISGDIHMRLGSGDITAKGNIKELCGREVMFEDGSKEEVDAIIYATGYKISFPFFKEKIIDTTDNDVALYKRVMDPKIDNLFFIGLVQPLCSIIPVAEVQSRWVAKYLAGRYELPCQHEMEVDMENMHGEIKKRYVSSKRHTIQIDCMEYTLDLYEESKRGGLRAEESSFALPVAARAQKLAFDIEKDDKAASNLPEGNTSQVTAQMEARP